MKQAALSIVTISLVLSTFSCLTRGEEPFNADIRGQKTWTLRYGVGDPRGLAQAGVGPYQLILDQSLAVDIHGEALSMFTIDAHFNDQEPASMQSLTVQMDAGDLQGVFGDFFISGKQTFAVYNKKLKGIRLDYRIGEAQLTGILSQIEGISESRTFVGRTAHEEILFSSFPPEQPWLDQPYSRHIDGLYHYALKEPYVEGFSEVALSFDPSEGLRGLLETYELSYLFDGIAESPSEELSKGSFTVVSEVKDALLLKSEPASLLRDRVREAITAYNQQEGLIGAEKKYYPFNIDSDYERAFLEQLAAFARLVVDGEAYRLTEGGRRRFYDLRRTNVKEDSIVVEVSLDGGTFRPITDPDLGDFCAVPFPAEGILKLDFPASFFAGRENAVRVSFDYAISGDMFMLGLSIVPGSEKVYLNGVLLKRDADYSIDYELGALILFVKVGDEDTIRIDYERFRGGLGGFAEYGRNFYGATLALPVSEALTLDVSLLQAADSAISLVDPDKAHTMPNTHTVSSVVGSLRLDDFTADFTVGYNVDQFPLDDNLRMNLPNAVTAILTLPDYVLVGHLNGVTVYHQGTWTSYNTADGLSGNRVYEVVSDGARVFLATGSGLTVLFLEKEAPLAQVKNWRRYYVESGLPHAVVQALALAEGTLWIGTGGGLASVRVEEMDEPSSWITYPSDPFTDLGSIVSLAKDGKILYVGTERGLFAFDETLGTLTESPLPGTGGLRVYDLLLVDQTLYVACELGLRSYRDGVGMGWLVFGEPVYALASLDGELWYGTRSGLFLSGKAEPFLTGWQINALASDAEGNLWAGSHADPAYQLLVWQINKTINPFSNMLTGIDGRDRARFTDIPPEGHTDRGLLGWVSFQRDMGAFTLSGNFESVSPAFTSIGRLDRRDSTGWNLTGSTEPIEGLNINASHSYYLVDQASDRPKKTMENRIAFGWDFGPFLDASLEQSLVNDNGLHKGFDDGNLSYAFSLRDHLFDEALNLGLSWNDGFNMNFLSGTVIRENRLGLEGTYQLTSDLSVAASWGRPMRVVGKTYSGSEKLDLALNWTHRFAMLNAGAGYSLSANRSLPGGSFRTTQSAKVDLRFEGFDLYAWQVMPGLDLNLEDKEGIISASGRGTLRGALDVFSVRATYSKEISGLWEQQQQENDRLSIGLDYVGLPDLRPMLTYTANNSAVIYKGTARSTFNQSLTGRLSWAPPNGFRDELSISIRESRQRDETTITTTLHNAFSYALTEALTTRLELDGDYAPGDESSALDLSLKGYADLTLSQTWRASLAASYYTGLKSSGGLYHGLLFELFVAATF